MASLQKVISKINIAGCRVTYRTKLGTVRFVANRVQANNEATHPSCCQQLLLSVEATAPNHSPSW